ncbi:hypothetical protein GWI33_007890 [Rhynchophorus ferrugineus]|uniref:Uncharacterized protein n=1 Tax=Rhynchophorus ferrugineus TaxID=354439 RepID=A0A834IHR3_RHYFE|nr:hypothetical protein GWI33_007890 [Rhynchophorus ferrugineus]
MMIPLRHLPAAFLSGIIPPEVHSIINLNGYALGSENCRGSIQSNGSGFSTAELCIPSRRRGRFKKPLSAPVKRKVILGENLYYLYARRRLSVSPLMRCLLLTKRVSFSLLRDCYLIFMLSWELTA